MLVEHFDFWMTMRQVLALEYGVGPVAALLPQLALVLAGVLAFAAPVLAQDAPPAESEPAPESQPESQPEPLIVTPEGAAVEPAPEPTAEAPADDATYLDTIEVTAGKRVRAQRDMPASIGAIRGDQLEQMRAQGMRDYLKLIPGVSYADQGDDSSVPIIR